MMTIDIGGTKIAYGLLKLTKTEAIADCLYQDFIPTQKGLPNLLDSIKSIHATLLQKAKDQSYQLAPYVLVGSAGNFDPNEETVVLPGTAENLGSFKGEFDGVNLKTVCEEALDNKYQFKIINDGLTQLAGGVLLCAQTYGNAFNVVGQKVAYVGPGTGLGGGFATVKENATFDFFTDGHIFDMAINDSVGAQARAEDLLSGHAFFKTTELTAQYVNHRHAYLTKFKGYVQTLGGYLGQVIEAIHTGNITKINNPNWSQSDINKVKGIQHFLIGGSLGTKGELATILIKEAKAYLKQRKLSSLKLWQLPSSESAALMGAKPFIDDWLFNEK